MEKNGKNGNEKLAVKYVCNYCLYECSKQSDYTKHLSTLKHARNQQNFQNGNKTRQTIFTCHCGNEYKGRDGLWKHQKTCIGNQNVENSPNVLFAYVVRSIRMHQVCGNTIKNVLEKMEIIRFLYIYRVNVAKLLIIMTRIFYI